MKNGFLIAMAVVMGTMPSRPAEASTIAFGWLSANIQNTLLGLDQYAKNGRARETGLRIGTDPDGAQVDFSRATADAPQGSATMTVYSALSGEGNESNYNPTGTATIDGAMAIATTATPEPGSLIMVGSALILIGIVMKRVQKKA